MSEDAEDVRSFRHDGRTCKATEANLRIAHSEIQRLQLQVADLTARIEAAEEYASRTLQILGNRA